MLNFEKGHQHQVGSVLTILLRMILSYSCKEKEKKQAKSPKTAAPADEILYHRKAFTRNHLCEQASWRTY